MSFNFSEINELTVPFGIIVGTDIVLGLTMVLGACANVVTICTIMRNKHMQSPMNISLISLAVVDLFACVLVIPLRLCLNNASLTGSSLKHVCKTLVFMKSLCDYAEPCMLVATSFERYQAIAKPFENRNKKRRIIIITVTTGVVCAMLASVGVMKFHDGAAIFPCHTLDDDHDGLLFREAFVTLPFGLGCISFVLIFYILMIRTLREHSNSLFKKSKPLRVRLPFSNKGNNKVTPTSSNSEKREPIPVKLDDIVDKKPTQTSSDQIKTNMRNTADKPTELNAIYTAIEDKRTLVNNITNTKTPTATLSMNTNSSNDSVPISQPDQEVSQKKEDNASSEKVKNRFRKLSIFLTRDNILTSNKRRTTVAEDIDSLIPKEPSRKLTTISQGHIVLIAAKDATLTTGYNTKPLETNTKLTEYTTEAGVSTVDGAGTSQGNKSTDVGFAEPCNDARTHNTTSTLLHINDVGANKPDGTVKAYINKIKPFANNLQDLNRESGYNSSDNVMERKIQSGNKRDLNLMYEEHSLDSTHLISVVKNKSNSNLLPNSSLQSSYVQNGVSSIKGVSATEVSPSRTTRDILNASNEQVKQSTEQHLSVLKCVTQDKHINLTSSNSTADKTTLPVNQNKDKDNDVKNIISKGKSVESPTKSSKTLNNIDIVDFDGTVHKDVLVEGPVCGAVCVMNPTNKVAGRRKVEMRAAKRIAILIGSFSLIWSLLPMTALVISSREYIVVKDVESLLITASISSTTVIVNPALNFLLNKQLRSASIALFKKLGNYFKRIL